MEEKKHYQGKRKEEPKQEKQKWFGEYDYREKYTNHRNCSVYDGHSNPPEFTKIFKRNDSYNIELSEFETMIKEWKKNSNAKLKELELQECHTTKEKEEKKERMNKDRKYKKKN